MKCLRKDEEERYRDAGELAAELSKVKKELSAAAYRSSTEQKKETEQKHATIVFMRIHKHQEILRELGNEKFVELLENYYDIVNKAAKKYTGTINKIDAGETVLYFGLPESIENSAYKALNAVVDISSLIGAIGREKYAVELFTETGVNTGMVIAGSISAGHKLEYTVIGDTLDLANELMKLSEKGQILIGPVTSRYTGTNFSLSLFKKIPLKGKRDPVSIYELHTASTKSFKNTLSSEMVGRSGELTFLQQLLDNAIKGEGSVVSILAEAGIGKSRLLTEFKKSPSLNEVLLLEGKSLSTASNTSYYPVVEMLKVWAGITEIDNDQICLTKLKKSVEKYFQNDEENIVPFIAAIMGLQPGDEYSERFNNVSGDALEKLIQKSMRLLILKGAETRPVVFIVEDLHWADHSSLDLIQSLLRLAEHHQILFISTMRPNYPDTGDLFRSGVNSKYGSFYKELILEALGNKECEFLLHNLLNSDLPVQLKNSIIRISEGNPYFIEEIIRALIDEGALKTEKDAFVLSRNLEDIVIPGSIRDVLLSRIDKLDEDTKHILKVAAVIGRYFLYEHIAKIVGTGSSLNSSLDYLITLELIRENDSAKGREYVFKHALVQEAVYETLLSKTKQELHLKTALAIEDLYSSRLSDFYEPLAYHYNLANEKDKAEEYLIKAGEKTLKSAASYEALNYFNEALKIYMSKYGTGADKNKLFSLEKNIGTAFYQKGYFKEAVEHFNRALELKGIKTRRNKLEEGLRLLYNFLGVIKRLYIPHSPQKTFSPDDYEIFDILFKNVIAYANHDGKKMFAELLSLVRKKMDFELNGIDGFITYSLSSSLFSFSGISFAISRKFIEKANNHSRMKGTDNIYINGYDETIYLCLTGKWKEFKKINEELLDLKIKSGELLYPVYQICWALYIIIGKGQYDYARYLLARGEEICEMYDYDYGRLYLLSMKADLNINIRNLDEAIRLYTQCCEMAEKLGLGSWMLGLSGKRAKAHLLLNNLTAAAESLKVAADAKNQANTLTPLLVCYYIAYSLLYSIKRYEKLVKERTDNESIIKAEAEIKKNIKSAIKVADKVAEIKPEVLRFIGVYYKLKSKPKQSLKYLIKSIEYSKYLDAKPEMARAYVELGKLSNEYKEISMKYNADHYFSEARNIFSELRLKWDLEQLNKFKTDPVQLNTYSLTTI